MVSIEEQDLLMINQTRLQIKKSCIKLCHYTAVQAIINNLLQIWHRPSCHRLVFVFSYDSVFNLPMQAMQIYYRLF